MSEKIIKCPICSDLIQFYIMEEALTGKKFPVSCIIYHGEHAFIAYLDSEMSICDIEKPFVIKTEAK